MAVPSSTPSSPLPRAARTQTSSRASPPWERWEAPLCPWTPVKACVCEGERQPSPLFPSVLLPLLSFIHDRSSVISQSGVCWRIGSSLLSVCTIVLLVMWLDFNALLLKWTTVSCLFWFCPAFLFLACQGTKDKKNNCLFISWLANSANMTSVLSG